MDVAHPGHKRGLGSRLLEKALMPIVATATTAAAGYAAKKGPALYDEYLAPRLRKPAAAPTSNGRRDTVSNDELQQRLAARAKHRSARRRTTRGGTT